MASETPLTLKGRRIELLCAAPSDKAYFLNGRVREGISEITEIQIELIINDATYDLKNLIGKAMGFKVFDPEQNDHEYFNGWCISVEVMDLWSNFRRVVAEVRPWPWFLTLRRNSRIYQDMDTVAIIAEVLQDNGYSANLEKKLSGTYDPRPYCVQYNETDYDFICRLMQQEGMHFSLTCSNSIEEQTFVLLDSGATTVDAGEVYFREMDEGAEIFESANLHTWSRKSQLTTGKITLNDFDFTASSNPTTRLETTKQRSTEFAKDLIEAYVHPGRYKDPTEGGQRAQAMLDAETASRFRASGTGNVLALRAGKEFTLEDHPDQTASGPKWLVVSSDLQFRSEESALGDFLGGSTRKMKRRNEQSIVDTPPGLAFYGAVECADKAKGYLPPQKTPWPRIVGVQTATVTGKDGEEIHTDEFGRIKVRFHWDRQGKADDTSSCWVRCVMPWSGESWGMISIPRVGQEVVIQFESGDPDRPICTGMVYNDIKKVPYALDKNKTQTGIVTRSTKDGNANTFHELIFEDLKDKEFVRLQSERDWKETIKNNAEITIGLEHQDPGDLTQTIHHTKTETIKTGDHNFTVETGNQTIHVEANHTETINGTSDQTIEGDTTQTVTSGNYTQTIESGNSDVTISSGDHTFATTVGSIDISAGTEIKLSVGGSSITITADGITIEAPTVTVKGTLAAEVTAPKVDIKGQANVKVTAALINLN